MGLFGPSTDASITDEVDTATSEKNVEEDWGLIMNICDKAGKSQEDAKNYLRAIIRRLYNSDPHIGVKAVTLLDACVKNSGRHFHIEIASRDFENDFIKLMTKANPATAKKLRESLKKWTENEFKSDPQLSLIPSLLSKLKNTYDFTIVEAPVKKQIPLSKDPNVVESQEEEEQILKAIELSLKESGSPRSTTSSVSNYNSSLYPSVNMNSTTTGGGTSGATPASGPPKELKKVRALYDFEAAEDNELTFNSGEIIFVIDDSDQNWWKGSNQRGEGLFPANFVTTDLEVEPEKFLYEKAKKIVQFKETTEVKVMKEEPVEEVEINEEKIDRLLHLLHEADPTNPEKDTQEMLNLEAEVNNMGPLIDAELERVDRKHAQLTQLSADLVEALGLYHTLMREPQFSPMNKLGYGYQQSVATSMPYHNGSMPPNVQMPPMPMGPPPGMTQSHDRPSAFMHAAGPPPPGMHFQPMAAVGTGLPPPQQQQGQLPQQLPPHIALQMHQQMMEDRRLDQHQHNMMHYQGGHGMVNYGPPGMVQPNFPASGPTSQTNIQNAPQGGPPYVTSSGHLPH